MVSFTPTMIRDHPLGGGAQDVGGSEVALGGSVAVSVRVPTCVNKGWLVSVEKNNCVVGVGNAGVSGGCEDSAIASEIPPMTNMMETRAMITPPPSCRRACMTISPRPVQARFSR